MAKCYENGIGCEINLSKAFHLFECAALKGHVDSLLEMSKYHELGLGCPKNVKEAYRLYQEALSQVLLGSGEHLNIMKKIKRLLRENPNLTSQSCVIL